MAESVPLEKPKTGKKEESCRYFKVKVLETHTAEEINEVINQNIDNQSIVFTGQSSSYVNISDFVELHITEKSNENTTKTTLKWVRLLSVMPNGIYYVTILKSKGSIYNCI